MRRKNSLPARILFGFAVAAAIWISARTLQAQEGAQAKPPAEGARVVEGRVKSEAAAPKSADTKTSASTTPTPTPSPTPDPRDLNSTVPLSLNNAQIDQVIKFLTDTTGKPVIKQPSVNAQITINSPTPVTRGRALELIYDALLLNTPPIYVIDLENSIQILPADALKGLRLRTIGATEDVQLQRETLEVAQKVYKLQNLSADDLTNQLKKFVPESVISGDSKTNTLVLTDRIGRLKTYDRIIHSLDQATTTAQTVVTFKLKHGDAVKIALLIGRILGQNTPNSGGGGSSSGLPPWMMGRGDNGGGSQSVPMITVGNVTIVPEASMNWLIISCPRTRVPEITRFVEQFDLEQTDDVKTRLIDIAHIDVNAVATAINQIFPDNNNKVEKEQVRVVAAEDGNRLIVYSSLKNYQVVEELVRNLDSDKAEKRETKTYRIKHLQVEDLADQLTKLFEEKESQTNRYYYWDYSGGNNQKTGTKPSFVPSPRNSSLLVMAKPKDFEFIERMITELDIEIESGGFQPHIYQIHNTDATELVKVLETLFKEKIQKQNTDDYWSWRYRGDNEKKGAFDQLFGDIRFVVDSVTNRIVALASHPADYQIIDDMIAQLDHLDPEATDIMVYTLKYARADEMADRLNNLFSEGTVQQPQAMQTQQTSDKDKKDEDVKKTAEAIRQVVFPWQSGSKEKGKDEKERPVNTMIGNVRVVPDVRSNKIMIASPSIYFNALRAVVKQLDLPEPQVYIKASIVQVVHGRDKRIGIRWTPDPGSIDPAELENAVTALGQLNLIDAVGGGANLSRVTSNFGDPPRRVIETDASRGKTILGADVNVTLLIQLLVKNSRSRVIQEPNICVNNNETGQIFFGAEYPFQANNQVTDVGSVNQSFVYQEVGINVDITPHINKEGRVVLRADVENSKIRPGESIQGQIIKDKDHFRTELAVNSGETMVIGGIRVGEESGIERQVPLLGSIPGLKHIFGKTDRSSTVRELVLFITPQVLDNAEDEKKVMQDTKERLNEIDQFKDKSLLPEQK